MANDIMQLNSPGIGETWRQKEGEIIVRVTSFLHNAPMSPSRTNTANKDITDKDIGSDGPGAVDAGIVSGSGPVESESKISIVTRVHSGMSASRLGELMTIGKDEFLSDWVRIIE